MKGLIIILFVFFLWGCEHPSAFRSVFIRDSSLYSLKSKNFELRIFVGGFDESFVFEECDSGDFVKCDADSNHPMPFQYTCKENYCEIEGFVRFYCANSCSIEWLVDSVVVKRVDLLEHPDHRTMEFIIDFNGEKCRVFSESWKLNLDSLFKKNYISNVAQ